MLVLNHTLRSLYSAKAVSQVTFVSLVTNQKFSQISPNISKSMDLAAFVLEVAKVFQAARYCYTETWGSSAAQPERFQKAPGSWFIASIKEKKKQEPWTSGKKPWSWQSSGAITNISGLGQFSVPYIKSLTQV